MRTFIHIFRACFILLLCQSAFAGDQFRLFWVPLGEDPTDYSAGPTVIDAAPHLGSTFVAEIFLENSPVSLRGVSLAFDCSVTGDFGASIVVESLFSETGREDFVFAGTGTSVFPGISLSLCPDGPARFGVANGGVSVSSPRFIATAVWSVSPDASGSFVVDFVDLGEETRVSDLDSQPIPGLVAEQLIFNIHCDPSAGADCNENGVRDACDIGQGVSDDCNANGVPDECDIANGTDVDTNGDGFADSCQMFRLFLVPEGDNPNDYPIGATMLNAPGLQGGTLDLEIYVQNAPEPIRGVETTLPCVADDTNAMAGTVQYLTDSLTIDDQRSDYFLAGCGTHFSAADTTCDPNMRTVGTFSGGECSNAESAPAYVGEFTIEISPEAAGTFAINFQNVGMATTVRNQATAIIPGLTADSLILNVGCPPTDCIDADDCICELDGDCTVGRCIDSMCSYTPTLIGDATRDGLVDINDIFCVLDGFQNKFPICTSDRVDVSPCTPDGLIDIQDIFIVLDAFQGADRCLTPCGHPFVP